MKDLRALLNAATPIVDAGVDDDGAYFVPAHIDIREHLRVRASGETTAEDLALIAALRNAAPALLDIAEAAQALVDDTLANAGNCPSCGEEDGTHTTDCRFAPLVAALKRLETK